MKAMIMCVPPPPPAPQPPTLMKSGFAYLSPPLCLSGLEVAEESNLSLSLSLSLSPAAVFGRGRGGGGAKEEREKRKRNFCPIVDSGRGGGGESLFSFLFLPFLPPPPPPSGNWRGMDSLSLFLFFALCSFFSHSPFSLSLFLLPQDFFHTHPFISPFPPPPSPL